jgi:hypothetical protein
MQPRCLRSRATRRQPSVISETVEAPPSMARRTSRIASSLGRHERARDGFAGVFAPFSPLSRLTRSGGSRARSIRLTVASSASMTAIRSPYSRLTSSSFASRSAASSLRRVSRPDRSSVVSASIARSRSVSPLIHAPLEVPGRCRLPASCTPNRSRMQRRVSAFRPASEYRPVRMPSLEPPGDATSSAELNRVLILSMGRRHLAVGCPKCGALILAVDWSRHEAWHRGSTERDA